MTPAAWEEWWERFAANLRAVGVTLETARDERGKVTRFQLLCDQCRTAWTFTFRRQGILPPDCPSVAALRFLGPQSGEDGLGSQVSSMPELRVQCRG